MVDFKRASARRMAWNKGALSPKESTHPFSRKESSLISYEEYSKMTELSGYDPSIFLGATLTEANTRRPPIPAGTVLKGTLGKPTTRQTEGKQEKNQGVIYTWVDIPVELDLASKPEIRTLVGMDKVTLTHSFRLDIAENGKGLDMASGRNNGLRQLREAVDMNQDGQPFQLLAVEGRFVNASIKNEPYQGEVFDKIAAISRLAA